MGLKGLYTFLCTLFLFIFWLVPQASYGYDLWDQGYVDSEPEYIRCGSACIGSPEIQAYLDNDYQVQQRGFYIEQEGADILRPKIPWAHSRTKWLRKFGRNLYRRKDAYSNSAFRIGILIEEEDKSAHSAVWREIRKPLLYSLRNQIIEPLRKKRGNIKAWFIEQSIDVGASAAGLDSNGRVVEVVDSDELNEKTSLKVSFSPKLDPWKGRYGFRVKSQAFRGLRDPLVLQFSYYYCESTWGVGDRICAYLHQYQVAMGYRYRVSLRDVSFHLAVYYESESLNPEAYIVDDEPYEFKPWGFRAQLRIAM